MSLIEVAIAIVVLSILIIVTFSGLTTFSRSIEDAAHREVAIGVGQGELHQWLSTPFNVVSDRVAVTIGSVAEITETVTVGPEGGYAYTVTSTLTRLSTDNTFGHSEEYIQIDVSVSWPYSGTLRTPVAYTGILSKD